MINMDKYVALESVDCPLGCPKGEKVVLRGHDLLHGLPGEFIVVKCARCDLMRTDPRPTQESMGVYYPDDYGPYRGTRVHNTARRSVLFACLRRLLSNIVDFRTHDIPVLSPGRMLEIGCASGSFLHKMAGEGWHVAGIEFSEHAAAAARSLGYPVHAGGVESAPAPTEPYDLVVGWMVLEHLHDPVAALERLRQWVRPGGWLVVSVPDASTIEFKIFKETWYGLHLPNHLYHFSQDTIIKVLEKSGWEVKKVMGQRTVTNLFGSIGLTLLKDNPDSRLGRFFLSLPTAGLWLNIVLYPVSYLMAILGQTGRITVWTQKT